MIAKSVTIRARIHGRQAAMIAATLLFAATALGVSACGGDDGSDSTSASADGETTVRIVMGPYLDYAPWLVAQEQGIAAEQGLNLEITTETTAADEFALVRRGDADMATSCHACTYPILAQFPDIQDWMISNHFKGFVVVGRNGEALTYEDALEETGSPEEAKREVVLSWKGKEFAVYGAFFKGLVKNAVEDEGLSLDDVTILDFPGDPAAAQAFINGEGDFFVGGLPQETKLLEDFPDDFVAVGGHEVLGPGGLWYSTMAAPADWLSANDETAMKLMAVWYRTMAYLREDPEASAQIMTDLINSSAATNFEPDVVQELMSEPDGLLGFYTLDEAEERIFNPESEIYWKTSAEFYAEANEDVLPEDFDLDAYATAEEYFNQFLQEEDLVDYVNEPF